MPKAEPLLTAGLAGLSQAHGDASRQRQAIERLVALYSAWAAAQARRHLQRHAVAARRLEACLVTLRLAADPPVRAAA